MVRDIVIAQSDGARPTFSGIAYDKLLLRLSDIEHITSRREASANVLDGCRRPPWSIRLTTDKPLPLACDTALLIGDIVERITKPVLVIETNTRHNRNIRINHVYGIKPTTQADLQDNGIK